jgi:hypothetical protein
VALEMVDRTPQELDFAQGLSGFERPELIEIAGVDIAAAGGVGEQIAQ